MASSPNVMRFSRGGSSAVSGSRRSTPTRPPVSVRAGIAAFSCVSRRAPARGDLTQQALERDDPAKIRLYVRPRCSARGGMITVTQRYEVRRHGGGIVDRAEPRWRPGRHRAAATLTTGKHAACVSITEMSRVSSAIADTRIPENASAPASRSRSSTKPRYATGSPAVCALGRTHGLPSPIISNATSRSRGRRQNISTTRSACFSLSIRPAATSSGPWPLNPSDALNVGSRRDGSNRSPATRSTGALGQWVR